MTRTAIFTTLAAAAALAGCNSKDHTIVGGPGGDETNTVKNAPVALPPSITASKSYRCKDNKLIYIDWLSDGSARVKNKATDVGTAVAPGTDLKGDSNAKTVTYKGQACDA